MSTYLFIDIIIAYVLDLIFGDPYWLPHPVRFIGLLIKKTEGFLRNIIKPYSNNKAKSELIAGVILALIVILTSFTVVWGILKIAGLVHPLLFHIVDIYFIYSALASKCLAAEAHKVYDVLKRNDIVEARKRLSMLVGRQTENLNEKEIIRGVVETTAENTVDGIISPLIYAALGTFYGLGAPLAYAFKAASTLDSMVGYMNEKYLYFGRASAKIDDAANYIPARLSGVIIPLGALLCGKNMLGSFQIMWRDRRNHKSPNCAYPEAAVAGALGIRIGGNNVYFGKVVEKPTIGDPDKELEAEDIANTIKLMYTSSFITLILCVVVLAAVYIR